MGNYYFDIETTGLDPKKDKIITIQYQELDRFTGKAIGKLVILKEWESSEREILQKFIKEYADKVRFNQNFENDDKKFKYICKGEGNIDEFKGREEIFQNNKLVHWMKYFGGEIK